MIAGSLLLPGTSHSRQRNLITSAAVTEATSPSTSPSIPHLRDLTLNPIINTQGMVAPESMEGMQDVASCKSFVFGLYDGKQKLQYIGFSKDLRNSLRTLLGRRPDKAFFFKAHGLPVFDQDAMMAVRDAWYSEVGGPPPGNKLALERSQWQQPVDAGAISQRGKLAAAEEKARVLQEALKARGCSEEFVANKTLLAEGVVDFMPARVLTAEELERQTAERQAAVRATRSAVALVDGLERKFTVSYTLKFPTNGGFMFDVTVALDGQESKHRVIVGREYYEPFDILAEEVVEAAFSLLLGLKVPRQTAAGPLASSTFPIKYFSTSQVEQWFGDEFRAELGKAIGQAMDGNRDAMFWRFNRLFDYGPLRQEDPGSLDTALGRGLGAAV